MPIIQVMTGSKPGVNSYQRGNSCTLISVAVIDAILSQAFGTDGELKHIVASAHQRADEHFYEKHRQIRTHSEGLRETEALLALNDMQGRGQPSLRYDRLPEVEIPYTPTVRSFITQLRELKNKRNSFDEQQINAFIERNFSLITLLYGRNFESIIRAIQSLYLYRHSGTELYSPNADILAAINDGRVGKNNIIATLAEPMPRDETPPANSMLKTKLEGLASGQGLTICGHQHTVSLTKKGDIYYSYDSIAGSLLYTNNAEHMYQALVMYFTDIQPAQGQISVCLWTAEHPVLANNTGTAPASSSPGRPPRPAPQPPILTDNTGFVPTSSSSSQSQQPAPPPIYGNSGSTLRPPSRPAPRPPTPTIMMPEAFVVGGVPNVDIAASSHGHQHAAPAIPGQAGAQISSKQQANQTAVSQTPLQAADFNDYRARQRTAIITDIQITEDSATELRIQATITKSQVTPATAPLAQDPLLASTAHAQTPPNPPLLTTQTETKDVVIKKQGSQLSSHFTAPAGVVDPVVLGLTMEAFIKSGQHIIKIEPQASKPKGRIKIAADIMLAAVKAGIVPVIQAAYYKAIEDTYPSLWIGIKAGIEALERNPAQHGAALATAIHLMQQLPQASLSPTSANSRSSAMFAQSQQSGSAHPTSRTDTNRPQR